ncbi:hypothetical protein CCUS01_04648 [Colletotrichum cuscutae]|uniref:Uncharacterized protein n=1 Tax=Colletotrichum cuscutae TaxID=1209917 RepID=A0AAI9V9X0_9PEZI|nr:hypothetical protein CCUS01_04648 [Colletotrichum cuscutae]
MCEVDCYNGGYVLHLDCNVEFGCSTRIQT